MHQANPYARAPERNTALNKNNPPHGLPHVRGWDPPLAAASLLESDKKVTSVRRLCGPANLTGRGGKTWLRIKSTGDTIKHRQIDTKQVC